MEHHWSHDWHYENTPLPNIGSRQRPRQHQHQLPTPPASLPRGLMSPPPHRSDFFGTGETTSTRNTRVPAVRSSRLLYTEECIHKFREWRSGGGSFSSPGNREKELVMKFSAREFHDFKKVLRIDDENEGKFPRYTYDASSSTLTIQCAPSPIHEKAVGIVSEGFHLTRGSLPANIRSRIDIVTNQKFVRFHGRYAGSEKIPDMAVEVANDFGVPEVKFILEVGLLETYEKLVQDARLWLEGTKTVSVVMLIKLHEDPPYRCPTHSLSDEEFAELQFSPKEEINEQIFTVSSPYGPAVYKGLIWVGGISGFVEIWGHDQESRLPSRICGPIDLLSADETMDNFFSLGDLIDVTHETDQAIRFDWGSYLNNLGRYIKQLAANRCYLTLKDREGRVNVLDYDFKPPSPASST